MTHSESIERLKKAILDEYPRLGLEDAFEFACHPGVACFNACCADVNIFLTPYDVLRLKNRLGLTSQEFIDRFTVFPVEKHLQYPVLVLKLREDETKKCHFVDPKRGCTVYEDRPWACRMYPVGLASPKEEPPGARAGGSGASASADQEFYFLMKEEGCFGFAERRRWTIRDWMSDQGIREYDEMGRLYKEVTLHDFFRGGRQLTPEKMEMFFIACYNLDKFRRLVFESSFFQRFRVEDALKEKLKTDDEELLRFGFRWLRFSLFGEKTMELAGGAAKDRSGRGPGRKGKEKRS